MYSTFNLLLPFQVVYFGDSMHSDIFPARHYSNWETVFILEELRGDEVITPVETESEPLEKKGKYEVRVPCSCFLEPKKQKQCRWPKLISKKKKLTYLANLLTASTFFHASSKLCQRVVA